MCFSLSCVTFALLVALLKLTDRTQTTLMGRKCEKNAVHFNQAIFDLLMATGKYYKITIGSAEGIASCVRNEATHCFNGLNQ